MEIKRSLIELFLFILENLFETDVIVTDQREAPSRRFSRANFYFFIGINSNNDNIDVNKYDERVRFACRSFLSPFAFIRVRPVVLHSSLVTAAKTVGSENKKRLISVSYAARMFSLLKTFRRQ